MHVKILTLNQHNASFFSNISGLQEEYTQVAYAVQKGKLFESFIFCGGFQELNEYINDSM